MARKKISEYKAKKLIYKALDMSYSGISINNDSDYVGKLDSSKKYVLKVDEGVKQRNKKGLVVFNIIEKNLSSEIDKLRKKGFSQFILEEFLEHDSKSEHYIAIERIREGKKIHYSTSGGINIEDNKELVKSLILKENKESNEIIDALNINEEIFDKLLNSFDDLYFSFLEINPLVVSNGELVFLDMAVEIDSTAAFFVNESWGKSDFRESRDRKKTVEELQIEKLKENSSASFSFEVLNKDGSIFLLLSGGGASLVIADEIYQQGQGKSLGNYGEYSGNPNQEETYIYTKNVLSTLLSSSSPNKVLIISGGVANFTDVRITFRGIIQALSVVSEQLRKQKVKVFVRRGGPHQDEGLDIMREFLEKEKLIGEVHGPDLILTDIVKPALDFVSK